MPQVAAQSQDEEPQCETNLEPKCKFEQIKTLAGSKAFDEYETNLRQQVSFSDIRERRGISTWVEFGRALVRAKTLHTCEERCEEINRLMQVVQTGTVVCMDGNYRGVWTTSRVTSFAACVATTSSGWTSVTCLCGSSSPCAQTRSGKSCK